METEIETVKIRTKKGRIITLTILKKSTTQLFGTDKFGADIILPIEDIDKMLPMETKVK